MISESGINNNISSHATQCRHFVCTDEDLPQHAECLKWFKHLGIQIDSRKELYHTLHIGVYISMYKSWKEWSYLCKKFYNMFLVLIVIL